MNLKDKTRIAARKNVYLSLITASICLVFSLFILIGSTWAWFSAEYESSSNTITIGSYGISLSLQKLNKVENEKLLTMVNDSKDDNDISVHEMVIDSSGDYLVRIIPSDKISGYCNLTITDENNNNLLEKDFLVIKIDKTISFNVHTNKNLKISISNVNWGNLTEYDELKEDYYFADFKFIYENGTVEYSELPANFKEVSYIDSNGKQYTEDIIVNENIIVDKTTFKQRIEGKNVIVDEDDKAIAYIYPCVDENEEGGLYVFDLVDKTEKFYPNIGEEDFEIGDIVKHYQYEFINNKDNIDVIYKDIVIEGKMDEDDTIYPYGVETKDKVKQCQYKMEGFHFIGWQYEDKIVENLNDILTTIDPTSPQDIILTAVWDINNKEFTIDDQKIDIKYRDELQAINDLPEKEGHKFKGYYYEDKMIIDENGNFVIDVFDWLNNEENKFTLKPRWERFVDKAEEKEADEKIEDIKEEIEENEVVSEETQINPEQSLENTEENNIETPNEELDTPTNTTEQ